MIRLNGETLSFDQVWRVARGGDQVSLSHDAIAAMQDSRDVVEKMAAGDQPVYGVNTGFGLLADKRVNANDLEALQRNLIRSHAVGIGEPLDKDVVRAMILIRANVLARGYSGIRPIVAERLCDLLNRDVTPIVPSRGSVGASGDLAPLAHIAMVLIGEGEAWLDGARMSGAEALQRAHLDPLVLAPKEGISLVNGTQAMLAIGCLELLRAEALADAADMICAMTLDGLRGTPVAFDPRIHNLRPHPGQMQSADNLRRLLEGSEIRESHITCKHVQDAYSLRCAPQVHGAVRDVLTSARWCFANELNAVTDNPIVVDGEILSGGNFHGEPLALQLDSMAIALAALAGISERRIDRMVNPALSEDLPAFLANQPGLESGFMMVQVSAAALVNELRVLATPASPGSITTDGNKEDFVSMGMTSALKLQHAVRNTRLVLAMELLTALRALDLRSPLKTSPPLERVRSALRLVAAPWQGDKALSQEIESVSGWLQSQVWREMIA
jgi:histidine ammonia-lyase